MVSTLLRAKINDASSQPSRLQHVSQTSSIKAAPRDDSGGENLVFAPTTIQVTQSHKTPIVTEIAFIST
jgi:hypothetical protein